MLVHYQGHLVGFVGATQYELIPELEGSTSTTYTASESKRSASGRSMSVAQPGVSPAGSAANADRNSHPRSKAGVPIYFHNFVVVKAGVGDVGAPARYVSAAGRRAWRSSGVRALPFWVPPGRGVMKRPVSGCRGERPLMEGR